MFRSVKFSLVRTLFVVVGLLGSVTVGQADNSVSGDTTPLEVLRAHLTRVGGFRGKSVNLAKPAKSKTVKVSARRAELSKLVATVARKHGVPVALAKAVVTVESNYNPRARGGVGEVGLMQIRPQTARGLGYRGTIKTLYAPKVNLEWGMRYLAKAHDLAGGDVCGTILRYNAGHGARRMNPISRRYCNKVKQILG